MAVSRAAAAVVVVVALAACLAAEAEQMDCGAACAARCRLASRAKMCERARGTCCARCNCVPPGTAGNEEACPCYYDQTTHGGRRKCP